MIDDHRHACGNLDRTLGRLEGPMTRETALENAVKLLLVENDCLREACGQSKLTNGNRDFPASELARGADFPGLVNLSFDGTLSVRMES